MQKLYFSSINLWCSKNLVDMQYLLWNIFMQANNNPNYDIQYFANPYDEKVSYVFLNTCWFIKSWRDEMFETIEKMLNQNKKIYILWCWLQYFQKLTSNILKDIENYEQKKWAEIITDVNVFMISRDDIDNISIQKLIKWYNSNTYWDFHNLNNTRAYTNIDLWFEYCKIAEWCNNSCSFCIIPKIRWKQKSKPIEEILLDIKNMISQWAKEIILIAQDSTRYWIDLYKKPYLLELAKEINWLDWTFLFRILYLYPDILTEQYLDELAKLEKFIPYFDIPLQHISDNLLNLMWRTYNTKKIFSFLKKIRKVFPVSYIRTNFIIGFPWETKKNVNDLVKFIKEWFFDNIALFEYHDEQLSASYKFPNKISDEEISQRFFFIKKIVEEFTNKKLYNGDNWWYVIGRDKKTLEIRPWLNAPDIDDTIKIWIDNVFSDKKNIELWDVVYW